jgi:AmmeMemoRadiSam system protein A
MFSNSEQQWLLSLARESIGFNLKSRRPYPVDPDLLTPALVEDRACFVTLSLDGQLRGCIGHLEAIQPLYKDVIENSVSAAFGDSRFPPLNEEEMDRVEIELSILGKPTDLPYKDADDLVKKLRPGKDGVVLGKGIHCATFLPQVWEQIKAPEGFLSRLCIKAGLDSEEWRKGKLGIQTYSVESFGESGGLGGQG